MTLESTFSSDKIDAEVSSQEDSIAKVIIGIYKNRENERFFQCWETNIKILTISAIYTVLRVLRTVTIDTNLVFPNKNVFDFRKKMIIIDLGGMRNFFKDTNGYTKSNILS